MSEKQEQLTAVEMKAIYDGQSVDWYLQRLVAIVNNTNVEFGLTLHVEGAIVSGLLVSGRRYFETFAQEFAGAYPDDEDGKENIRKALASHASIYDEPQAETEVLPPQFIHLLNARSFVPGGKPLPSNRGVLWRGKINSVSGFSLGSLSAG